MKKNFKSIICLLFALVVMTSMFVVPAGATNTDENVEIVFYKPDSWGNNIKIHLWNAGSLNTQWPGLDMTQNSNGTYTFSSSEINSCNFVINDGNGNQTADLYAEGYVGVKDNCVFRRSDDTIRLYFEKPDNWSSNIRVYYYTNDNNQVSLKSWPGVSMIKNYNEDTYYATISDMADARVIFTDGVNQYPKANEPGIAVSAGQELIFEDNKYIIGDNNWIQVQQPKNHVNVGENFEVNISMTDGSDFPLYFYDEDNTYVAPVGYTETAYNGKVDRKYIFNFDTADQKTIKVYYYYENSLGNTQKTVDVHVREENNGYCSIESDKYSLNNGETFTLAVEKNEVLGAYFFDENGNSIEYDSINYDNATGKTYYTITADQVGKGQRIYLYTSYKHNPGNKTNTGLYVTIDVWQAVNI